MYVFIVAPIYSRLFKKIEIYINIMKIEVITSISIRNTLPVSVRISRTQIFMKNPIKGGIPAIEAMIRKIKNFSF